ncbi:plant UBX domain-containing protein 8 isoform X1 [Canna indica]|uniref:Plant UBX domain-containing protein 8 isoform X1 n=1 Tax=Canna indica TaxID=4628 RepID=A0AAQ3KFJ8_9LILI|nr:plant UBX domain-containing protein 8 isoform X1 [Canna indica]
MARSSRDAIDTFMNITGTSETVALQKLEEHDGDLNRAINAHFIEVDRVDTNQVSAPPYEDILDIESHLDNEPPRPDLPFLSAARDVNPFSLLDSNFGLFPSIFDGRVSSGFPTHGPRVSHPREVREVPIEFKDDNRGTSGLGPRIEDVTGNVTAHGQEIHGTVIIDDEDDEEMIQHGAKASTGSSLDQRAGPSISPVVDADYNNDLEEEMIRAAIEASKREAEQHELHGHRKSPAPDDTDLARAVSLSLETAEQERALRQYGILIEENPSFMEVEGSGTVAAFDGRNEIDSSETGTSNQVKSEARNPSVSEEAEDTEEQPLLRQRSRHISPVSVESADPRQASFSSSSLPQLDIYRHPQDNGHAFEPDEWGGISSEEHDEAIMLEAAMFGSVPDRTTHRFRQTPRLPSPTLAAQRLLREQQDDEYLAALQADREKELKAQHEVELRLLEEAATREAALHRQKHEEEENLRKQIEKEEIERKLAAKEASLPQEPSSDDENAVTVLVRMPDGSRRGRRFLKSDKLQFLYDYIDIGKVVKPGSYRLVRPYPRRSFGQGESELSLSELGLTSKQEALFLELI